MRSLLTILCWAILNCLCACSNPAGNNGADGALNMDASVGVDAGTSVDAASGDPSLTGLAVSAGMLSPAFSPATTVYAVRVPPWTETLQVMAMATDAGATIQINGTQGTVGGASVPIPIAAVTTMIAVVVQAPGGASRSYSIAVMRSQMPSSYFKASNTGGGDNFGYSLSLSGDTLAVGAYEEDSNATGVNGTQTNNSALGSGAVYIFRLAGTTWTQEAYLKASNTEAGDHFGNSVSLSGDTLAVGAPQEDSNATGVNGTQTNNSAVDSGAVYIFRRNGTTWAQEAYIKSSNTEAGDNFGDSVSVSGDTLAVGATGESSNAIGVNGNQTDNSASRAGAVYVFLRTGNTWAQQAYLKASNTGTDDAFGFSISLSGDTLAVGAEFESSNATGVNGNQNDDSASRAGAVYVFLRAGTTWAQQAYLKASNTGANDNLGISVSLSGDTLVVGAYMESSIATGVNGTQNSNTASGAGAAYVFQRTGTTWAQQAYLKASNTEAGDFLGFSISVSGDTVAIGAVNEAGAGTGINGNQTDNSAGGAGAVYVFR